MNINLACAHILSQLTDLVAQINEDDFIRPSDQLSQSTIGQHLRHTLEFFICFERGYQQGIVNYDKRSHDKQIERDKYIALATIGRIESFVKSFKEKELKLEVGYDLSQEEYVTINTTAMRELVYNIEHAVHHMAIIKIGIREVAPYVSLAKDFGVAASTIRYHEATVASH
jgi:uncharacterized damage-inducible protein DinB